jgi:hypothetical protein
VYLDAHAAAYERLVYGRYLREEPERIMSRRYYALARISPCIYIRYVVACYVDPDLADRDASPADF